jgi:glycosyltransferase involved in cell wall biosynthesis
VIVVDDGSTDSTPQIVEGAGPPVSLIRGPQAGAAEARNAGARAARAEAIAFTDSDCFPTPGWLAAGLSALAESDLVQGQVRPDPGPEPWPFDRSLWVLGPSPLFESANLFVRRAAFERAGGFEAPLALGGRPMGEDVLFGWKLRRTGARTTYAPDALVHHEVFRDGGRRIVSERLRSREWPRLAGVIPELREHFFFGRWFLSRRSAAFDAALAASATAALRRSPLPLAAALPYLALLWKEAERWPGDRPRVAAVHLLADAVNLAALAAGSANARELVL